jgi:hypothetical protein
MFVFIKFDTESFTKPCERIPAEVEIAQWRTMQEDMPSRSLLEDSFPSETLFDESLDQSATCFTPSDI